MTTNHIVRQSPSASFVVSRNKSLLIRYISDYRGNKILVGLSSANIALFLVAKLYYVRLNQQKDKNWNLLSDAEKFEYLALTKDTGMKKKNIRFVH
jgi:hypothetical protein